MALSLDFPIWKEAPFLRLLIPFIGGIVLAKSFPLPFVLPVAAAAILFLALPLFYSRRLFVRFKFHWLNGIVINGILLVAGYLLFAQQDETQKKFSLLNQYKGGNVITAVLKEKPAAKKNSLRSIARIDLMYNERQVQKVPGNIMIFFQQDSISKQLDEGTTILFSRPLEEIRNSGNPGAFDYKDYCRSQGIYFTVYLSSANYLVLPGTKSNVVDKALLQIRNWVLTQISIFVPGKKEAGFAKALLIGYKDELDKELISDYSKTGAVHIIAISGLHLGIIFLLLNLIVQPIQKKLHSRWLGTIVILVGLWTFTLITGAGPSVLRSAFMFSFIVLGKSISKNSNIYNNLAVSAFLLLCFNPNWLWDAGFQLSYLAVLSIVIFFRHIYHWLYFQNKLVDFIWKANAVTLSAQILTLPVAIYHFHQVPIYFLLSNLLAVPWSSGILIGELLLCCVSALHPVAQFVGAILESSILYLNDYIERISALPFSTWTALHISFLQLTLLYGMIIGISASIIQKQKRFIPFALGCLFIFLCIRSYSFYKATNQQQLIIYNIPKTRAIDVVEGRKFLRLGDTAFLNVPSIYQFYLRPSETLLRMTSASKLAGVMKEGPLLSMGGKNVLLLDAGFQIPSRVAPVSAIILSQDAQIDLPFLLSQVHPSIVIADASNHYIKLRSWKHICDSLAINFHNVSADGAIGLALR
jgi:competence protein ComEC